MSWFWELYCFPWLMCEVAWIGLDFSDSSSYEKSVTLRKLRNKVWCKVTPSRAILLTRRPLFPRVVFLQAYVATYWITMKATKGIHRGLGKTTEWTAISSILYIYYNPTDLPFSLSVFILLWSQLFFQVDVLFIYWEHYNLTPSWSSLQ